MWSEARPWLSRAISNLQTNFRYSEQLKFGSPKVRAPRQSDLMLKCNYWLNRGTKQVIVTLAFKFGLGL
jgi:hypothetical protein